MGIEQVVHDYRELDEANGYGADIYDIATMKIHHTYKPSENYCMVELKIPAVRYQMYQSDYDSILESLRLPSLHGLRYLTVDNYEFYEMLKKENRDTIDKVRIEFDGYVYSYYFSNSRKLKFFEHDYYMPMFIYLGYPKRSYVRRTPCAQIDPKCTTCWDTLRAPVRSYLYENLEEQNAHFYDYFFTVIEDNHRLLMGYTVEPIKNPGECFSTKEPDYYILDYDSMYFKGGISKKLEFEKRIISNKREKNEDIYHFSLKVSSINFGDSDDGDNGYNMVSYQGGGGSTGFRKINIRNRDCPQDIIDALDSWDFEAVWKFDFINFNMRNTIHKYQYNHWAFKCTREDDGLWCAWDATETIDAGIESAPGDSSDKAEVKSQLLQVSSMFGWGPSADMSSTDTVFIFTYYKEEGINYEDVIEPLPQRDLSLF
jgi:hypothetical protein